MSLRKYSAVTDCVECNKPDGVPSNITSPPFFPANGPIYTKMILLHEKDLLYLAFFHRSLFILIIHSYCFSFLLSKPQLFPVR